MKRFFLYALIFCVLFSLCCLACSDPRKAALKELERRKIPFTEQKFLEKAFEGDIDAIKQFIIAGINKDARTAEEGYNALMIAAMKGQESMVRLLVSANADKIIKDEKGFDAAAYVRHNGFEYIARIIEGRD